MNLTTCFRKYNPNVFRQVDPYADPIYLQSPHHPQTTLSQTLIIPRSRTSHNAPHIYNDCHSCEDDPRTGAHFCRTCIEAQYYTLKAQSQAQSQIQDMYINYTTCECPHCDSGLNSSTYTTSRAYPSAGARFSNMNMEPITQQIHNTVRYTPMPSNRLGQSPYRDVGQLGAGSCLGTMGGLSGPGALAGMGGLGGIGGVRDVRDLREMRNYSGRYGLQKSRLGYRL